MNQSLTPQEFVAKWRSSTLKEKSSYQEHFIDLCRLVGHKTPAEDDPTGERFVFEAGAKKLGGGQGWADVWKKGFFALEYKGKEADLGRAYKQLQQYYESLQSPPLLVVCDIDRIIVHTKFLNTVKREITITLDDLLTPNGLKNLRAIFYDPDFFKPGQTTEQVTEEAAKQFSKLADHLRKKGEEPPRIAHFLIRLLFCLFAEDIGLLPRTLFSRMIDLGRYKPNPFNQQLRQLFAAMATGGYFGVDAILHFNGGLFDSDDVLDLDVDALRILYGVSGLDWSAIEPSILGTLFERSLDPGKRKQLGAHYTGKDDILLIVEPVLMAPLRRKWLETKERVEKELARLDALIEKWRERRDVTQQQRTSQINAFRTETSNRILKEIQQFWEVLRGTRVLDPACGSGNFLYVALKQLLDLWKESAVLLAQVNYTYIPPLDLAPSPHQLFGIEINDYAYELAQTTVWIGYIQWLHENGYGTPSEPILKPLHNIQHMDAILAYNEAGKPIEPTWPEADVIIGNPPFLGDKKMKGELGAEYVERLRQLYSGRVPGGADFVTYWFELARSLLERETIRRVGLLSTNSIRGGANRQILDKIKETGDIFMAWADRPWFLDGASVRVSIIGFDAGHETDKWLDGQPVAFINADLTCSANLTVAVQLRENENLSFIGTQKGGKFDIPNTEAQKLLNKVGNPNGRPNSDVIFPWINGLDITRRPRNNWIIDFGTSMPFDRASEYEAPFEYVAEKVKKTRVDTNSEERTAQIWRLHQRPRPEMRAALSNLSRYIATPRNGRYRVFVHIPIRTIPDSQIVVIARSDDYMLGILSSKLHELWSLQMCTWLGVGNDPRYTPTTTFETFPFPWPPGKEPVDDPLVQTIAQAAKELVEKRDVWLNPPGLNEAELKKRTLTNLYNQRPTWLDLAHKKLDAAVFAAYSWPTELSDEEILERLLALNLERASNS